MTIWVNLNECITRRNDVSVPGDWAYYVEDFVRFVSARVRGCIRLVACYSVFPRHQERSEEYTVTVVACAFLLRKRKRRHGLCVKQLRILRRSLIFSIMVGST